MEPFKINEKDQLFTVRTQKTNNSSVFAGCTLPHISNLDFLKKRFSNTNIIQMNQVHGTDINFIDPTNLAIQKKTDGILTNMPNTLLVAYCADCVPIYFYSSSGNMVGIIHAGWKGTRDGIVNKMVDSFVQKGTPLNEINVIIGPSIGPCCFETRSDMFLSFKSGVGDALWRRVSDRINNEKIKIDLKLTNRILLEEKGIIKNKIMSSQFCTCCQSDFFHSYRRDKSLSGRTLFWIYFKK